MLSPDGKVRTRDTRVGPQDEDHGMRLRNQVDGQFRLGTYGIEARGIQDHQPLLEQGMRHIDQGVAPHGNLHQALCILCWILIRQFIMPKAHGPRIIDADTAYLRNFFERFCNLPGIMDIQGGFYPAIRFEPPFRQTMHLQAGFNRQ